MKEGDEWKAAFCTNQGLFEPLVMFFGLTNSPAAFQTTMNDIFWELIMEGVVVVYLDDILIFMETIEQHHEVTRRVLKLLEENKLFLKPDKCEFEKTKVEYLGVIISHNSVEMDPVKVARVVEWPVLTSKKDSVQRLSPGTSQRPGLNWTKTDQDQNLCGLTRTVIAVQSLVHLHLDNLKTEQRPVLTGLFMAQICIIDCILLIKLTLTLTLIEK